MNSENIYSELTKDFDSALLDGNLSEMTDEVGSVIPVVKEIVSIFKMSKSLSDHFFKKKILRFLLAIKDIDAKERRRFFDRLNQDEDLRDSAGEEVLKILMTIDDSKKEALVGTLFVNSIKEGIPAALVLKYARMIVRVDYYDLKMAIKAWENDATDDDQSIYEGMFHAGLACVSELEGTGLSSYGGDNSTGVIYALNKCGIELCRLLSEQTIEREE